MIACSSAARPRSRAAPRASRSADCSSRTRPSSNSRRESATATADSAAAHERDACAARTAAARASALRGRGNSPWPSGGPRRSSPARRSGRAAIAAQCHDPVNGARSPAGRTRRCLRSRADGLWRPRRSGGRLDSLREPDGGTDGLPGAQGHRSSRRALNAELAREGAGRATARPRTTLSCRSLRRGRPSRCSARRR